MMTNEMKQQIPSTPAGPQLVGEKGESTENTSITAVPEYSPQGEGDAGSEGLA